MGRVAILARAVADQIAAGEVVERPASVVKELVENALDAGASRIAVEIEDGGRALVRVSDDGEGMDRDDALLALDRHATSKIREASDLVGVATYGFRGEALPAIASVSRLELETAPRRADGGSGPATRIVVEAGTVERVDPAARTHGTTVTVRRLFVHTPARRKFLRSQRSETRAAVEVLTVLALSRLDVHFSLTSDGRARLDAPAVIEPIERIAALFGRDLAETLLPVIDAGAGADCRVHGFTQRPVEAKQTGRKAYLFVNGRPFRDPFLVRAAESGYRATIAPEQRPTVFLALDVPGERVDVNVHPAKLEVRFRDKIVVERAVEAAVRAALRPIEAAAVVRGSWAPTPWSGRAGEGAEAGGGAAAGELFGVAPAAEAAPGGVGDVLQVFQTYLVFETPEGLAIVDQHSAHERVLFEQAIAQLTSGGTASQRLLLPFTLDLEPLELEAVERHGDLLQTIGYEVAPFGGRSVAVHAVPNPHPRFDARRCLEELVGDLAHDRFGGLANRLERFAATYGCRAAIKAGHRLAASEMRELLNRLFTCDLPPHDVHGRPTIVQLPRHEMERRFGRA